MTVHGALRSIIVVLAGLVGALPSVAVAAPGTNNTITTSFSSQSGPINALVVLLEDTIGPGTIIIGDRTGCLLVPPPTLANCNPTGGAGTSGDPYICSPTFALTGCGGGTQFQVLAGTANLNLHTQTVIAVAPAPTQPVPLSPWVPAGSALGAMLLALWMRRRPNVATASASSSGSVPRTHRIGHGDRSAGGGSQGRAERVAVD